MNTLSLAAAFTLCVCTFPAVASGQIVAGFPLHAIQLGAGECDIADPCSYGINTRVFPGFLTVAYIWARNIGPIAGIQTAFDWDPGTWTLAYSEWNCQQGQVTTHVPSGPGSVDGTISTLFDCATYGSSSWMIGKLYMIPSSGCLRQVQSAMPSGTCVFACSGGAWEVDPQACGTICVNEPGLVACWPAPVEPTTWGRIKVQY